MAKLPGTSRSNVGVNPVPTARRQQVIACMYACVCVLASEQGSQATLMLHHLPSYAPWSAIHQLLHPTPDNVIPSLTHEAEWLIA